MLRGLPVLLAATLLASPLRAGEPAPPPKPALDDGSAKPDGGGAAKPATPVPAGKSYGDNVQHLEERLQKLRLKVFESSRRMDLLEKMVSKDVMTHARVIVRHENRMGGTFKPVSIRYVLDGQVLAERSDVAKVLDDQPHVELMNANLLPGTHKLEVVLVYRGDAPMPYMNDYKFTLRARFNFQADKGKITTVTGFGFERGDATYDASQRPWVGFDVAKLDYTAENLEQVVPRQGAAQPGPDGTPAPPAAPSPPAARKTTPAPGPAAP